MAVRYARVCARARAHRLAAVARRRPRDEDVGWLVSWALSYLRVALAVSVAALALIAVKAISAEPDAPALIGAATLENFVVPTWGANHPVIWTILTPDEITAGALALGLGPGAVAYSRFGMLFGHRRCEIYTVAPNSVG